MISVHSTTDKAKFQMDPQIARNAFIFFHAKVWEHEEGRSGRGETLEAAADRQASGI